MSMLRRRPLADRRQFYTYIWRYDGVVIYAGYGRDNRGRPTCRASWSGRCVALRHLLREHAFEITWEVFPHVCKIDAQFHEVMLILELRPTYNVAPGIGGFKGMHTADGLQRIRAAQLGRKMPEEQRAAHIRRMRGNTHGRAHVGNTFRKGYVTSEETKRKLSAASKGWRASPEQCKNYKAAALRREAVKRGEVG